MAAGVTTAEDHALDAVATGKGDDPFAILGPHPITRDGAPAIVIRTLQPSASSVEIVDGDRVVPMTRRHRDGLFEAVLDAGGPAHGGPSPRIRIPRGGSAPRRV